MDTANATVKARQHVDVMLVDDDRVILLFLSKILEKSHFQVVSLESPTDALKKLEQIRPEVIVADINMPEMDGYEFYRRVRDMGHGDIPFLFCSGRGKPSDRIIGLRMGAEDYLSKPIEPEELVLKVRLQITRNQYTRALKTALENNDSHSIMSGNFGGITVADLLQSTSMMGQGNYCIHLTTTDDSGEIYLTSGLLLHAETGWLSGEKAFFRMLSWDSGTFSIEHKEYEFEPSITGRIDDHLLDKLTQLDEFRLLREQILAKGSQFEIIPAAIRNSLPEEKAALLSLVQTYNTLDTILDHSTQSDLATLTALQEMLSEGYLRILPTS